MNTRARRKHAGEWEHGPTCVDCGGPKAEQHTRCRPCWRDNVLRTETYWSVRVCPVCDGAKDRRSQMCRRCTDVAKVGKPRVGPVVVAADHKWRRMRFGKAAA